VNDTVKLVRPVPDMQRGENYRLAKANALEMWANVYGEAIDANTTAVEVAADNGDTTLAAQVRSLNGLLRERRNGLIDHVHRLRAAGK